MNSDQLNPPTDLAGKPVAAANPTSSALDGSMSEGEPSFDYREDEDDDGSQYVEDLFL